MHSVTDATCSFDLRVPVVDQYARKAVGLLHHADADRNNIDLYRLLERTKEERTAQHEQTKVRAKRAEKTQRMPLRHARDAEHSDGMDYAAHRRDYCNPGQKRTGLHHVQIQEQRDKKRNVLGCVSMRADGHGQLVLGDIGYCLLAQSHPRNIVAECRVEKNQDSRAKKKDVDVQSIAPLEVSVTLTARMRG